MSILQSLEQISFKKIVGLTLVVGIALAVPLTVWVSQKETHLAGRAYFEKPELIKPVKKYGLASKQAPHIALVWPFLGKVGDAVLIEGENFGDNPRNKSLTVNGRPVSENDIHRWTPNLIEFLVPKGASSGTIRLQTGGKSASWPYFFTVYNLETKPQVTENNDIVKVLNAPQGAKIEVFFSDGQSVESERIDGLGVPSDKTIISVIVKNKSGSPIPFFVEPDEFGF